MADLLDDIAKAVGAIYLSDLHENADTRSRIPRAVKELPQGRYSPAQWKAAVCYIQKDDTLAPENEHEAQALLCKNNKGDISQGGRKT